MVPFLRSPYNYDMFLASDESAIFFFDESLAQQSMKEETDINTIVMRFGLTGKLPEGVRQPQFADFVNAMDYQSSLNAVIAAQEAFMEMPASVRTRFHNNPAAFLEFVGNDDNREEAKRLGLVPGDPLPPAVPPAAPGPATPLPGG